MLQSKNNKFGIFSAFIFTVFLQLFSGIQVLAETPATERLPLSSSLNADHTNAVKLARDGHPADALIVLNRLHQENPNDISITRDNLVVAEWAGHDSEAIKLYESLPKDGNPEYVYASAAHSYRNLHQPIRALDTYRLGLRVSPNNTALLAGEILSLTDAEQYDNSLKAVYTDLTQHGDDPELLIAAGNATDTIAEKDPRQHNQLYQAFRYYQRAVDIAPANHEAIRGLIHVTDLLGMPQVALEMDKKYPGLLTATERRRIEGDEAAAWIRWGTLEPKDEVSRYKETDAALARLDALILQWSKQGKAAEGDVVRAHLDRVVALRNRNRMQDAIQEYNSLRAANILIPTYVLSAVVDAYLYLHHPEKARDIALIILAAEPKNFEARRQLFYAYIECDDFDNAFTTIDQLDQDQGVWVRLKGLPTPLPNAYREVADLDASLARLYGEELDEADDRISAIESAAPYNSNNRKALGDVYSARGWPRAAEEQYAIGQAIQPYGQDVGNETGRAETALTLQDYTDAESRIANLMQRFPENLEVQRLDNAWQNHNKAELLVDANYSARPSTSVSGGEGYGVSATVYSVPFYYNWRIFAGQSFAHEAEPQDEGLVGLWRSKVGVEYRNGPITLEAAPTLNQYHDTDHVGGYTKAEWTLNDQWTADLAGELFSRNTPLRALNRGIRANEVDAGITWRQSESRSVTLSTSALPFSDGNFRSEESIAYQERLWTSPHWKVDGLVNGGLSQNSDNELRPYYNPASDFLGEVGPRVTQVLYHRYEMLYEHSLQFTPGLYSERHFGNSFAYGLRYEQHLRTSDTFEANAGVGLARQAYDGVYENDLNVTLDLVKRF